MRLSPRVVNLKPSATLAVSAKAKSLRAEGVDIVSFGAGEPDFDTPDHIKETAISAIREGWTRYMPSAGDPAAREAIAKKLRDENGLEVSVSNIVITPGGKHGIYLAALALIDPDREDEVVIPTPGWVSYRPIAELVGGRPVEIGATLESGFRMTPDQLRAALTPKSRLLILNSPSNPCGTMYTPDELQTIAKIVNEHNKAGGDLVVLSDEIYEKLVFGDIPFASIGKWLDPESVITLNGLSKSYAMTGWRIGYVAAPTDVAGAMTRLQSQMNTCITACCYPTIRRALEHGDDDIARMKEAFARRARLIFELARAIPGFQVVEPTGAFYIFPDVSTHFGKRTPKERRVDSALSFANALLEEAHVAVVPGEDFGGCGGNHIRLSFAVSDDDIRTGLERLRRFVESLAG